MLEEYKYVGLAPVAIQGYGIVQPNEVFKTEIIINNPLFIKVENKKKVTNKKLK